MITPRTEVAALPGKGTLIGVQVKSGQLLDLERCIAAEDDSLSRPEAVRCLLMNDLNEAGQQ